MAFDPDLADRIRELVSAERGLEEKRMFGGLAFLINGNMAIAANRTGGLLVRVPPEEAEQPMAVVSSGRQGRVSVKTLAGATTRDGAGLNSASAWVLAAARYAPSTLGCS